MSKEETKKHRKWVACSLEEEYYGDSVKQSRKERKRKSASDRSKFKKTDLKKHSDSSNQKQLERLSDRDLFKGRILSINSQGATVEFEQKLYTCSIRGLLKKEKTQFKNLVTVGDFVLFEQASADEGMIVHVEPRHSLLSRADNLSRRKEQLIAANIDQVIITSSVVPPEFKPFLIDRYIIAARKGKMSPVIVVNKIDLLETDPIQNEIFLEFLESYQSTGIPIIPLSAETGEGMDDLRAVMRDKSSVFSGQSGTGKSSLINAITGLSFAVGDTVKKTNKGSHTTTTAQLVPLDFGGWCIDTPGIKSFGVWDLEVDEIQQYFAEISECSSRCKYPDCTHTHETECAILDGVEKGEIAQLRYESYLALISTITDRHLRR